MNTGTINKRTPKVLLQKNVGPEVIGVHRHIWGNFRAITGDVTNLKQNISKVRGCATGKSGKISPLLKGDFSNITGDITDVTGDVTEASGDVTNIQTDLTDIRGDVNSLYNLIKMTLRHLILKYSRGR